MNLDRIVLVLIFFIVGIFFEGCKIKEMSYNIEGREFYRQLSMKELKINKYTRIDYPSGIAFYNIYLASIHDYYITDIDQLKVVNNQNDTVLLKMDFENKDYIVRFYNSRNKLIHLNDLRAIFVKDSMFIPIGYQDTTNWRSRKNYFVIDSVRRVKIIEGRRDENIKLDTSSIQDTIKIKYRYEHSLVNYSYVFQPLSFLSVHSLGYYYNAPFNRLSLFCFGKRILPYRGGELGLSLSGDKILYFKGNIVTFGLSQLMIDVSNSNSASNNDKTWLGYTTIFSLFLPSGIIIMNDIKNTIFRYGIVLNFLGFSHWNLLNKGELNNYVFETGIMIQCPFNKIGTFAVKMLASYQRSMSSKSVQAKDISRDNVFLTFSLAYVWNKKNKHIYK